MRLPENRSFDHAGTGSEKSNGIGGGVMKIKGNEFEIGNLTKPACALENEIFQLR
jgi:hypothetical protein